MSVPLMRLERNLSKPQIQWLRQSHCMWNMISNGVSCALICLSCLRIWPNGISYAATFGCHWKSCMERSAVFHMYGMRGLRNCSCSRPWICMLKLLTLADSHCHVSPARHPCSTLVQRRIALHGSCLHQPGHNRSPASPTGYHVKLSTQLQTGYHKSCQQEAATVSDARRCACIHS